MMSDIGNKTRFRLEFDIELFRERWRPIIIRYFKGEITASEACRTLGYTRSEWERHMAGIFSIAVDVENSLASIEEVKEAGGQ